MNISKVTICLLFAFVICALMCKAVGNLSRSYIETEEEKEELKVLAELFESLKEEEEKDIRTLFESLKEEKDNRKK